MSDRSFEGRVAVVTGASSGIGEAVARALASRGARVAAIARRASRLQQLSESVPGVHGYPVDLLDETAVCARFAEIEAQLGPVDILVNNAGLGHDATLLDGDSTQWREMFDVNVLALCVCTREAVRQMRTHDRAGHVIHISSMAGHRVPQESGVYSATKFAVRALTEGLRRELRAIKSPIRVCSVSPGNVKTEFHAQYYQSEEAAAESYARYTPLAPEDVAASVLHALSAPPHVQIHDILLRSTEQPD
ncbi:MAG: SDR family NAD(P)-dependent oxidoreductase [Myxococcota bacterium]